MNVPVEQIGSDGHGTPKTARKTEEGLLDRLMEALHNAVELEIVTVVSDFTIENFDDPKKAMTTKLGNDPKGFLTSINMLTGDIRNAISPAYADAAGDKLGAFHLEQVELGRAVVANNLRVIGELAEKMRAWIKEDTASSGEV